MYLAEVLAKLPVAQHFLFGPLLPFPCTLSSESEETESHEDGDVHIDDDGHLHVRGQGWGECCGIAVPSAFAAAKAGDEKKGIGVEAGQLRTGPAIRRIPFD